MTTVDLQPASNFDLETITDTFNAGYEGYIMPVNIPPEYMQHNIETNDLKRDLSLIAIHDDAPIGICMVGQRRNVGWIGGLGVALPHRRQGIGWQLMEGALNNAREAGVKAMTLEVIVGNDGAYAMYQRLGFETTEKLLILTREPAELDSPALPDFTVETQAFDVIESHYEKFHAIENAWQRQLPSLQTDAEQFTNFVAMQDGVVQAYAITRILDPVILLMDVAIDANQQDALRAILHTLHSTHPDKPARIVNIHENDPCVATLQSMGYVENMAQYEMKLTL